MSVRENDRHPDRKITLHIGKIVDMAFFRIMQPTYPSPHRSAVHVAEKLSKLKKCPPKLTKCPPKLTKFPPKLTKFHKNQKKFLYNPIPTKNTTGTVSHSKERDKFSGIPFQYSTAGESRFCVRLCRKSHRYHCLDSIDKRDSRKGLREIIGKY